MKSEKWYAAMHARKNKGTNQYTKAKKLGLPKPVITLESHLKRSKASKRPHSEETKRKISESRIKYLTKNPDKVPYLLNHYSKGRSYPEKYWKIILDSNDLQYEEQYRIGLYQLDFAFIDKNIDLEIDGDQHYLDEKIIKSDQRRDKYLEELGWIVIRVKWSEYQKNSNKKDYVNSIIKQIMDRCPSGRW